MEEVRGLEYVWNRCRIGWEYSVPGPYPSRALISAPTAPKSIWPVYFAFSTPMTRPMSLIEAWPPT